MTYKLGSGEVTGSFMFDPETAEKWAEWLQAGSDEVRRTVEVTHEYHWSRWHRAVNAFLRFMLWPIGPEPLPVSYSIATPGMRVTHMEETDDGIYIEFSTSSVSKSMSSAEPPSVSHE